MLGFVDPKSKAAPIGIQSFIPFELNTFDTRKLASKQKTKP